MSITGSYRLAVSCHRSDLVTHSGGHPSGPNLTSIRGLAGWGSPVVLATAAVGLALLGALVLIERRGVDPLVPPALLRNRNVVTAVALASMFAATFGSVLYFLSIYLQDVRGYDALRTGMAFLLPTAVVVTGSTVAGQLVTRFGLRRTLVADAKRVRTGALNVRHATGHVVLQAGSQSPEWPR